MSKWYVLFSDLCEIQYFIFQNIECVTSSDIRHAALQRQAKVLRMVSNTRIIGHNHRWLTKREKVNIKIPSKLEVAPHALKMWTGWMDGWVGDTP